MPSLTSSLGEGIFGKQNPQAVWESSRSLKVVGRRGSFFLTSPESQGSVPGQLWDYSCLVNKNKTKAYRETVLAFLLKKKREISSMDFFKEGRSVNWGVPGAASRMLVGKALMCQSMETTQSIVHCSDEETEAGRASGSLYPDPRTV